MTLLNPSGLPAEHPGECAVGGDRIRRGDQITKIPDGWAHVRCIGIELAAADREDQAGRWDGTDDDSMGF